MWDAWGRVENGRLGISRVKPAGEQRNGKYRVGLLEVPLPTIRNAANVETNGVSVGVEAMKVVEDAWQRKEGRSTR